MTKNWVVPKEKYKEKFKRLTVKYEDKRDSE
jgi:hypothetical protein